MKISPSTLNTKRLPGNTGGLPWRGRKCFQGKSLVFIFFKVIIHGAYPVILVGYPGENKFLVTKFLPGNLRIYKSLQGNSTLTLTLTLNTCELPWRIANTRRLPGRRLLIKK